MTTRYDPNKPIFASITEGVAIHVRPRSSTFQSPGSVVATGKVADGQPLAGVWLTEHGNTFEEAKATLFRKYHNERPWNAPVPVNKVNQISAADMMKHVQMARDFLRNGGDISLLPISTLLAAFDLAEARAQSEMLRAENEKARADMERAHANEWLTQLHDEQQRPLAQQLAKEEARANDLDEQLETVLQLVIDSVDWAGKNRVPTHAPLFLAVRDLLEARRK